ncbi:MAG: DNA-processing protein DprA [Actinomycetota bacterium]|nr:DNA-processing protein DprA [Actinomycetota bacterium]
MERAHLAALACLPDIKVMSLPGLLNLAGGPVELWGIIAGGGRRAAALVGADRAAEWREACRLMDPGSIIKDLRRRGIGVLIPFDEAYPERLGAIYDPPPLLFTRGSLLQGKRPCVAIVGSRGASDYGRWASESMAAELARRGVVVVSGAAYGVDGRAHQGCIRAGGFTIAVMGCGVDRVYPAGHAGLLEHVARSGCILSEFAPGSDPLPWRFPQRNRIIAGLSHAVVVVEASERSGALITADIALDEGREVMALPGPITSPLSRGTNTLIQKGAKLVTCADDICEELPHLPDIKEEDRNAGDVPGELKDGEKEIIELLRRGPRGLDWLSVSSGIPAGELLPLLTSLSLKGVILEEVGGRYRLLSKI